MSLGSYDVEISAGLIHQPGTWARLVRNDRLVIIADEIVWRGHGDGIVRAMSAAGIALHLIVRQADEALKSWDALGVLCEELLALDVDRSEPVIALGGGVIGDVAGFASAIVKRGCPVVHVPSTLLAQVDSAIGGKTAVNSVHGKNMLGVVHQPSAVIIDPTVLSTLPDRQMRSGMAEVVKYGLIADADFFAWCEANARRVVERDGEALRTAIASSVRFKARFVAGDEQDRSGQRALLNFGHTFAHAFEAETGYSQRLLHGEAVALGMVLALKLSEALGRIDAHFVERAERLLRSLGLPVDPREVVSGLRAGPIVERMQADKKKKDGQLPLVLLDAPGHAFLSNDISRERLEEFLERQFAGT